jgi:hypothetical protein
MAAVVAGRRVQPRPVPDHGLDLFVAGRGAAEHGQGGALELDRGRAGLHPARRGHRRLLVRARLPDPQGRRAADAGAGHGGDGGGVRLPGRHPWAAGLFPRDHALRHRLPVDGADPRHPCAGGGVQAPRPAVRPLLHLGLGRRRRRAGDGAFGHARLPRRLARALDDPRGADGHHRRDLHPAGRLAGLAGQTGRGDRPRRRRRGGQAACVAGLPHRDRLDRQAGDPHAAVLRAAGRLLRPSVRRHHHRQLLGRPPHRARRLAEAGRGHARGGVAGRHRGPCGRRRRRRPDRPALAAALRPAGADRRLAGAQRRPQRPEPDHLRGRQRLRLRRHGAGGDAAAAELLRPHPQSGDLLPDLPDRRGLGAGAGDRRGAPRRHRRISDNISALRRGDRCDLPWGDLHAAAAQVGVGGIAGPDAAARPPPPPPRRRK